MRQNSDNPYATKLGSKASALRKCVCCVWTEQYEIWSGMDRY